MSDQLKQQYNKRLGLEYHRDVVRSKFPPFPARIVPKLIHIAALGDFGLLLYKLNMGCVPASTSSISATSW